MKEQDPDLSFKPITPGLGFHPFSDGLPYTPQVRKAAKRAFDRSTAGTGATAAGLPLYRLPQTAKAVLPQQQVLSAPILPQVKESIKEEEKLNYIYLLKRIGAFVFDLTINSSLGGGALTLAMEFQGIEPRLLFGKGVIVLTLAFLVVFSWAVVSAQDVIFGTSVGKRTFGLALEGGAIAILLRALFFWLSVFSGLGLLWMIFDRRKRCWHDLISGISPAEIHS